MIAGGSTLLRCVGTCRLAGRIQAHQRIFVSLIPPSDMFCDCLGGRLMRAGVGNQGLDIKGAGATGRQEEQERKWHVHCPVCGCKLGRSKWSDSDIECHKCHSMIGILVSEGMVTVVDKTEYVDSDHRRRAAVYMEKITRMLAAEA